MNKASFAASLSIAALLSTTTPAQTADALPGPGPEHAQLGRFVGRWTGKGTLKPGPFGPGGSMSWTETCDWFPGRFSVVCHSDGKGPMGDLKGMGIIGYKPEEKTYTYYVVDNTGYSGLATGTLLGSTWTFTGDEHVGGKTFKSRLILEEKSPRSRRFTWETSQDGKTWSTMMDGESAK